MADEFKNFFISKIWKDRVSTYPLRRLLHELNDNGDTLETKQVNVERDEGLVGEQGNQFSAFEMNNLEDRVEIAFNNYEQEYDKQIKDLTDTQNLNLANTAAALNASIASVNQNIRSIIPIRTGSFTLVVAGWVQYSASGQTLFRQTITGVSAVANERLDVSTAIEYVNQIYSDLVPINTNGTLTVHTAIKPTVNIPIQYFLIPTRGA